MVRWMAMWGAPRSSRVFQEVNEVKTIFIKISAFFILRETLQRLQDISKEAEYKSSYKKQL